MSDIEMPDLLPDEVLTALREIRDAGIREGSGGASGSYDSDTAIADAISAILAYEAAALTAAEARGRDAERARTVALIESLSEESKRQELDTQADQLTSIMYGGRVTAFARLLDELDRLTVEEQG